MESLKIRDRIKGLRRIPADKLDPHPQNWRVHPEQQRSALSTVLDKVGWADAIVAREIGKGRYQILDGHLRAETAGDEKVPVLVVDLDDQEAQLVLATHDPLAGMADHDVDYLGDLLDSLSGISEDVDELLASISSTYDLESSDEPEKLEDVEPQIDRAEELREKWGTERGQVWIIEGKQTHRLMCGDVQSDIDEIVDGDEVSAVVTDPPYGIGYGYDEHDDSRAKWFDLVNKVIPMFRSLARFVVMPVCRIDRLDWWYAHHRPDWVMCWYKGSPGHRSHVGFNDWEPHLVWGKPPSKMHDFWQTRCGSDVDGHPCPKPLEYSAWLVERAATEGDVIVDPFLGSGTTMLAAEQLNRRCYGMEISPAYCAVILQRMTDAGCKCRLHEGANV